MGVGLVLECWLFNYDNILPKILAENDSINRRLLKFARTIIPRNFIPQSVKTISKVALVVYMTSRVLSATVFHS